MRRLQYYPGGIQYFGYDMQNLVTLVCFFRTELQGRCKNPLIQPYNGTSTV
jgi:hypothetical protein